MLFRFDPFEELERMAGKRPGLLAMDATRTDDEVVVYFDAPGVSPDDLEVTTEGDSITVSATRRWFDADTQVLARERTQGQFRRQIQVGSNVDLEAMKAKLEHGVLTLSLPIAERAKSRKVQIDARTNERQLETTAS